MVTPPIYKFLALVAHHPRAHAAQGRVVAVKKLSLVGASFVGNLSFVSVLPSALVPPGMTVRTLAKYDRGGAVIFYDTSASFKLVLSKDQNRNFLRSIERNPVKISDVSSIIYERVPCLYVFCIAGRQTKEYFFRPVVF